MILSTSKEPLPNIMRDFKKFTFNELVKMIERMNESRKESIFYLFSEVADNLRRVSGYKVWQDGNHPELFFLPHFAKQKPDYLQHNPVADEVVYYPEEYWYNSARDYYSKKNGYLEVPIME